MPRTITVKGVGKVSTPPDYVIIGINIESKGKNYESAINFAEKKIEDIKLALKKIGFDRRSLKTTDFHIHADYARAEDLRDTPDNVSTGYVCRHFLKVEFDFDTKLLGQALDAISKSISEASLTISFTLKDPTEIKRELLRSATANAREKAKILCEASNATLGPLVNITYDWDEINFVSNTKLNLDEDFMSHGISAKEFKIDIEPEDVKSNDTATFVWEIR